MALQDVYICMLSSLLLFFSPENKITSWWGGRQEGGIFGKGERNTTGHHPRREKIRAPGQGDEASCGFPPASLPTPAPPAWRSPGRPSVPG